MRFLVLLCYYNRPQMVRYALESLKAQTYHNWHLGIVDDGSDEPIAPIAAGILGDLSHSVTRLDDTPEMKMAQGGSRFGSAWNDFIRTIPSDIVVVLCDDDALYPDYLENLNDYYKQNPTVEYSYCHVSPFNPTTEAPHPAFEHRTFPYNYTHPLAPACVVDSSQVTWRTTASTVKSCLFPEVRTCNLDAHIFGELCVHLGPCVFNGIRGQYKGWFPGQLSHRMGREEAALYQIND